MAKLKEMSDDEVFETAVEAGIYTETGTLAKHYTVESQ